MKHECTYSQVSVQWQMFMGSMAKWRRRLCLPNGRFGGGSYSCPVTSSIVGPTDKASASGLLSTILPMEAVMVLRYRDPVEASHTTLLVLILEILGGIILTAAMTVEAPQPSCVGSGILQQVMTPTKPWGRGEGYTTASALVGGEVGSVGVWDKQIGGRVSAILENGQALPLGLSISLCQGVPLATSVVSCLSVGGPKTWLNIVIEVGQLPSASFSILRPYNMSLVVMVTNSHMAWHSSLTLSARGQASGLIGRWHFSTQCCKHWQYAMVRSASLHLTSWYSSHSGRKAPLMRLLGAGGTEYS